MIGTLTSAALPATPPTSGAAVRLPVSDQSRRVNESETFQILLRARAGDSDAVELLCARYLPRLHRWARGRLPRGARSTVDTGDIVQEVLVSVIKRLQVFEPRDEGAFQGTSVRRSPIDSSTRDGAPLPVPPRLRSIAPGPQTARRRSRSPSAAKGWSATSEPSTN